MSELSRHRSVGCKGWERTRICDRRKADLRATTVPLSEDIVESQMSGDGVIGLKMHRVELKARRVRRNRVVVSVASGVGVYTPCTP